MVRYAVTIKDLRPRIVAEGDPDPWKSEKNLDIPAGLRYNIFERGTAVYRDGEIARQQIGEHMIQDLHSHTYYSFCGEDTPESIVEAAIAGGIDTFGISDHNHGIGHARVNVFFEQNAVSPDVHPFDYGRTLRRYYDHINLIREKYADRIRVLRGIEVCTLGGEGCYGHPLPDTADISFFDYCLLENLDDPRSVTGGDLFAYAHRCGCPWVGVAHTDLFGHIAHRGEDPYDYFARMAEQNIFWEMNVSYDSIHRYREHPYMLDFFSDPTKQEIVRRAGVRVSIGFDGHRVGDYLPDRVADYNRRLTEMGIKKPFE